MESQDTKFEQKITGILRTNENILRNISIYFFTKLYKRLLDLFNEICKPMHINFFSQFMYSCINFIIELNLKILTLY